MIFTSWAFVEFFAAIMIGLLTLPNRPLRQALILIASIFFYAYWKASYVLLIAVPTVVDYLCALRIEDNQGRGRKKAWLAASVVTNLGLLGYFKYTNFFLESVSRLLQVPVKRLSIILPIGISFFTFKSLSYTVDVFRGDVKACRQFWKYAMFVMYFPELIAGPIVRASIFLPQMTRSLRPSWARTVVGLQVVLIGVTKKMVIADRLAIFADEVFASPELYSPLTVASAVVAYSLQIYCDFSGYSDIAIGISRIVGFDLPENFNMPYSATSITEFWSRWHMTLSKWLRDYVYIPLGGNRKSTARTYFNLFATILLGGLWHGASWTFVVWGILHAFYLITHKLWIRAFPARSSNLLTRFAGWILTFAVVNFGWIFFRSADFGSAFMMIRKITGQAPGGIVWLYTPLLGLLPLILAAHGLGLVCERMAGGRARVILLPPAWLSSSYAMGGNRFAVRPHSAAGIYSLLPLPSFLGTFLLTLWLLTIFLFATLKTNPFIYFQF